jgi:hypothetical protein
MIWFTIGLYDQLPVLLPGPLPEPLLCLVELESRPPELTPERPSFLSLSPLPLHFPPFSRKDGCDYCFRRDAQDGQQAYVCVPRGRDKRERESRRRLGPKTSS